MSTVMTRDLLASILMPNSKERARQLRQYFNTTQSWYCFTKFSGSIQYLKSKLFTERNLKVTKLALNYIALDHFSMRDWPCSRDNWVFEDYIMTAAG